MMPVPRRGRQARRSPRPRAATARGNRLPSYYGHLAEASAGHAGLYYARDIQQRCDALFEEPCQHLAEKKSLVRGWGGKN